MRRREGEVRPYRVLPLFIEGHDALIVIEAAGEEVARAIGGAATHGHVVVAFDAVAQPRIHVQVLRAIALAETGAATPRSGVGGIHRVETERTLAIEALTCFEGPRRRADRAPFGEDLNHSGRRLRAVERRRRRPLQNFDTLDVVRIDVVERARVVVGAAEVRAGRWHIFRILVAPHAHAINIDQRLIGQRDTCVATEPDRCARASRWSTKSGSLAAIPQC